MKISLIINILHHAICVFSNTQKCEFEFILDCVRHNYQRSDFTFEKTFLLPEEISFFCNRKTEASTIKHFSRFGSQQLSNLSCLCLGRYITLTATLKNDAHKALFIIPKSNAAWVATAATKFETVERKSQTILFDLNEEILVLPQSFKEDKDTEKVNYNFCLTKGKTTGCIEVHKDFILFKDGEDVVMGWRDMARFGVQFRKDDTMYSVAFGVSPIQSTNGLEATWTEQ